MPTWVPKTEILQRKLEEEEEELSDWGKAWQEMQPWLQPVARGFEQTFTMAGATLTTPWRMKELGELAKEAPIVSPYPRGRGYQQYLEWKEKRKDPHQITPFPTWKQWGSMIKPVLQAIFPHTARALGVEKWEEPETFEFARMGVAEMAEFAPLMLVTPARAGKTVIEEAGELITKQLGGGKTTEEAIRIAYDTLAKKGRLPKPVAPVSKVPPVTPEVTTVTQAEELRRGIGTLAKTTDDRAYRRALGEGTEFWDETVYNQLKAGKRITVFRAAPIEERTISLGDRVTHTEASAKAVFNEFYLKGEGHILKAQATADDLIPQLPSEFLYVKKGTPVKAIPKAKAITPEVEIPTKAIPEILKSPSPTPLKNPLPHTSPTPLTPAKARKQIKLVANELTEHLGAPIKKAPPIITKDTMKQGVWNRMGEQAEGFANRTYRVENILLRADKYTNMGKMWQTFYQPLNKAANRIISRKFYRADIFKRLLERNKIDSGKWQNTLVEIGGIKLTPFERIGIYLHQLNPDNLVHVVFGNNVPMTTINKVVASLTPEEKVVAQFFQQYYLRQTPIMAGAYKQVTGKVMRTVENYSPIQIQRKAMEMLDFNQFIISEAQARGAARWASARVRKGFTLPRTGKAMQPVELDASQIWWKHLEGVEHYQAMLPVVQDLQRLLADGQFRHAFINTQGRPAYQVMETWLKKVAQTNPLVPANQFEAYAGLFRQNAVTAVLGVNIITAMKQFPSYFAGMAEIGAMPVLRGLFTFTRHPKETMKIMRRYAPEIYFRRASFERELAEIASRRGAFGKMSKREISMIMTTSMDRLAVNSIWRGAWDDALKQGMTPKMAAERASMTIRRTQPFFSMKDLAEFWRAGELAKGLTMFTNQLNQYWNYYRFHIWGKARAGQISKFQVITRVIDTFVIPALMIGAITRSRPAQDAREFATDLASMGFATIPIFGNWITSGIRGFTSSGIITTEVLDKIREASYTANKEQWGRLAIISAEIAGYAKGIPVAQPSRTIRAFWDIAQGKVDDWFTLIWGTYVRGQAEEEEEGLERGGGGLERPGGGLER